MSVAKQPSRAPWSGPRRRRDAAAKAGSCRFAPGLWATVMSLLALLVLSAAGGAVYLVTAAALRAPELAQLRDHLRRRRSARSR